MYNHDDFGQFFKAAFGIDIKNMEIGIEIDVKNFQIEVLSYNRNTDKTEFNLVNTIIRKPDSLLYEVHIGETIIRCSKDHKFYCKLGEDKLPVYQELHLLYTLVKQGASIYLLDNEQKFIKINQIVKTNVVAPIYDMEVKGNNNLFTNGFLSHNTIFGDNMTTQGGLALEFYSHIRLKCTRSTAVANSIMEDDIKMGNKHKVEVFKNKVAAPFRKAEYDIIYGEGIDIYDELVTLGLEYEVFTKSGGWTTCDGEKYANAKFLEKLKTDKAFFTDLRTRTLASGLAKTSKTTTIEEETLEK